MPLDPENAIVELPRERYPDPQLFDRRRRVPVKPGIELRELVCRGHAQPGIRNFVRKRCRLDETRASVIGAALLGVDVCERDERRRSEVGAAEL